LPGVRGLVEDVRIEVLLRDGVRLVVLVDPLGRGAPSEPGGPGAIVAGRGGIGHDGRERRELAVSNTSRRVIRVSSHFPFDRVNQRLAFDRAAAAGFRLDIESGSSERWAPGETRTVTLVRFGGDASPEPGTDA